MKSVLPNMPNVTELFFAAAVADYTPKTKATGKIKKSDGPLMLELERTVDIAKKLGSKKKPDQLHVGFALESDEGNASAKRKLQDKNLDFIVLNSLRDEGAGFAHDTNKIKMLFASGEEIDLPLALKKSLSVDIVDQIERLLKKH